MIPAIRLTGRWQRLARIVWVVAAIVSLALWLIGAYANFSEPLPSCLEASCDPFALSLEDYALMETLGLPAGMLLVFWNAGAVITGIFFFLTAALIFWRSREDTFALVISFFLIFLGSAAFTEFDDALSRTYPILQLPLDVIFSVGWTSLVLVFFFFPDGRQVPAKRWLTWFIAVAILPFAFLGAGPARGAEISLIGPLLIVVLVGGLIAQVYRYRRISGPVQKQQTKWVLLGLVGAAMTMMLWVGTLLFFPPFPATPQRINALLLIRPVIILTILLLPLTISFSILRYRLWDIDLIVRRTATYTLVTGILAAVYFGGVVLLQALLSSLTGQSDSPLVTVLSTLAIAALFNPLRHRIQNFIDRRFYRQKYDAERILARFSNTARDEVDLARLAVTLLATVSETVQPDHLSLWLKAQKKL